MVNVQEAIKERARLALARRDFVRFLGYVKVREATPGDEEEEGNIIPFELWPHLGEVARLLGRERLLVWLKARQIGASWTLAAYALWVASFRPNSEVLMFSQGELYAWKLLGKCKFVWENLPGELKVKAQGRWRQGDVRFTNGSEIQALPSTEDAGSGWTGTLVVMDEADKHPYLGANLSSVKPAIDAGAQMVMVSTPKPENLVSPFRETFRAAPENGWKAVYYNWRVRPGRGDDFRERMLREAPESERWRIQYEYSETEGEALAPPQAHRVFDMEVYESMMRTDVRPPVRVMGAATGIWQEFQPGKKYSAFTDTSGGVGRDFSVTVVLDCETGVIAADVFTRRMDAISFAYESVALLKEYRNPLWAVECNDPSGTGLVVIQQALRVNYPRLWRDKQDRDPKNPGPAGWYTDKDNRPLLWYGLVAAFKARLVTVLHREGLEQFNQVIRNERGRVEAQVGGNDDYPLAVAGAWYIRDWAHRAGGLWRPGEAEPTARGVVKIGF